MDVVSGAGRGAAGQESAGQESAGRESAGHEAGHEADRQAADRQAGERRTGERGAGRSPAAARAPEHGAAEREGAERGAAALLPPAFDLVAAGPRDAFEAALGAARGGAGAGTFVLADRPGLFDAAVVLEPEMALARAWPAALATALAAAEALGALGPEGVPVTLDWPDRILVNGALAGGVRAAAAPGAPPEAAPDWLVTGVSLRLRHEGAARRAPGLDPDRTALEEEGFGAVAAAALAASFARHLLHRLHEWLEVGPAPLAAHWTARADPGPGGAAARPAIDPLTGDRLGAAEGGGVRRASLGEALRRPSWSLGAPGTGARA